MSRYPKRVVPSLPHSVYPADWMKEGEVRAAETLGLTLYHLMERAGRAAFNRCRQYYPLVRRWLVLCGHGNNGGDGYVVARLARAAGIHVTLMAVDAGARPLPPEASQAREAWLRAGGEIAVAGPALPQEAGLIIDGLLGIGLKSAPRAPYDTLIEAINRHPAPVMALDIPSGLDADTGYAAGSVVRATHTQTFIGLKPGHLTGQARDWVGCLHCDALGLETWLAGEPVPMSRWDRSDVSRWLSARRPCSHKGENGRLLLIGGDHGMAGAIRMAAEASLRSGAGLVRVLTHNEHIGPLLTARPELMAQELTATTLRASLEWADVIVIGPGLGQDVWGQKALELTRQSNKMALWDADALNLLAQKPDVRQNRILTPHPGEAARLLKSSVAQVERDRPAAVRELQRRYGGVVVLKGAGTLIAGEDGISVADVGNPGMGSGGMGDVLSGIIGGLLAQKLPAYGAACAGVVVHGAAADRVAEKNGERGMIATDLLPEISLLVNP
ncbi:NAD(P)H-hydrate epimerase [Enterobacillus tribolii]|uniref:Bifunctional NAD(P)H-hydrate repair enzyme n=2 Tax=Enterobacillus tribolii TaxID=1487935 RepID=A0A370R0Z3_9GAMM|nr:NAD(P)H-hydrate epimerase [Enterobacillus tribolii]